MSDRLALRPLVLLCGVATLTACSISAPEPAAELSSRPTTGAERTPAVDPPSSTPIDPTAPSLVSLAPGPTADIACGRWSGAWPDGAIVVGGAYSRGGPRACEDREYPMGLDTRAVAGVVVELEVQLGDCAMVVRGNDEAPDALSSDAPSAPTVLDVDSGGALLASAADGARLSLTIHASERSPECVERARATTRLLASTLVEAPLGNGGAVHLTLSSAGHGMDLTLPACVFAVSLGGMADVFETGYELRSGDGHALATIYCAWDPDSDPRAPTTRIDRRVMRAPHVFTAEEREVGDIAVDLRERCEPSARIDTGPERRLGVSIFLCGAAAERATSTILRDARFTPPWAPIEE